jgi:hypothetical protein
MTAFGSSLSTGPPVNSSYGPINSSSREAVILFLFDEKEGILEPPQNPVGFGKTSSVKENRKSLNRPQRGLEASLCSGGNGMCIR